jgi:peptidoglycan/LPS O-acetylase OafA/YrhL
MPQCGSVPRFDGQGRPAVHKPGLDTLRAIAIAWVMLFHSFLVGGVGPGFEWLSRYGWMGVDIFFVLSGYLIGSQVLRSLAGTGTLSLREFYRRRAFRILPAFAVVLAVYALLPGLREAPGMEPWWKFAAFFMNLSIDYGHNQAFSHAWSLCVEEHFYLVFPLLAFGLYRRISVRGFVLLCLAIVAAGIALRVGMWLHDAAAEAAGAPARNWFVEDIYYPTWNRLDGLLVGVVIAALKVYRPQWWAAGQAQANNALLGGLAMLALSFWLFRDRPGLLGNSIGWPVLSASLGLLVFAAAGDRSLLSRRIPGMAWIAAISYSLYLSHKIVFHVVSLSLGAAIEGNGLLAFACYALATIAVGAALHYAVERPFLRLRDRRGAGAAIEASASPA